VPKKKTRRRVKIEQSCCQGYPKWYPLGALQKWQNVPVRATNKQNCRKKNLDLVAIDHGIASLPTKVTTIIDSGVNKTLLSETAWSSIKQQPGHPKIKLKRNRTKFTPSVTNFELILGRTKCQLKAPGGKGISTIVYVVEEETQPLLGLKDTEALGIIEIHPSLVQQLTTEELKLDSARKIKTKLTNRWNWQTDETATTDSLFQGLGKAKVEPYWDRSIHPAHHIAVHRKIQNKSGKW